MTFLFEDYNTLSNYGMLPEVPRFVVENLRPKFALRPYQTDAFARFVHFYERDQRSNKQRRPYHLLYNMATGSGKTNIMAGLVLYLYAQGYRDFLFFVSSDAVIRKTKDNFLNDRSSKYVFNERLMFDGRQVTVKEVQTFDESDPQNINIKFTTIQLLHSDMTTPKENSVSLEDFQTPSTWPPAARKRWTATGRTPYRAYIARTRTTYCWSLRQRWTWKRHR